MKIVNTNNGGDYPNERFVKPVATGTVAPAAAPSQDITTTFSALSELKTDADLHEFARAWCEQECLERPAAAPSAKVRIDYTVLHQFADDKNISYNELCAAVQQAVAPAQTTRALSAGTVYVCPDKDIECGPRPPGMVHVSINLDTGEYKSEPWPPTP